MHPTHTPAEWLAFLSLGASGYASFSVFYFLLVDAHRTDFDLRPAVRRVLESGRVDPLLIVVGPVKADVREAVADVRQFARLSLRDAAISVAALLALLLPAPTKGAL